VKISQPKDFFNEQSAWTTAKGNGNGKGDDEIKD